MKKDSANKIQDVYTKEEVFFMIVANNKEWETKIEKYKKKFKKGWMYSRDNIIREIDKICSNNCPQIKSNVNKSEDTNNKICEEKS